MNVLVADHAIVIRLAAFFGIFLLIALWEGLAPRRVPRTPKARRWFTNLALTFFNSLVGRALLLIPGAALAMNAELHGWGILTRLNLPPLAAGVISIVVLDFTIYLQHLIFHKAPLLWPLHGLHHTDLDIDVTTGARFHPLEIALSLMIKMGTIVIVGVPAWSFLIFEILLNGTSLFNHANIRIPPKADRLVRLFLVTPDMHRVHHSVLIRERDSNFGFNLPWWDRLLGTYRDQPAAGHTDMVIGLANFRNPENLSFLKLLALPFVQWRKF